MFIFVFACVGLRIYLEFSCSLSAIQIHQTVKVFGSSLMILSHSFK